MSRPIVGKAMLRRSKLGSKSSGLFKFGHCNLLLIVGYIVFIAVVLIVGPHHSNSNTQSFGEPQPTRAPRHDQFANHHWTDARRAEQAREVHSSPLVKEEPYEHVGHKVDQRLETCLKGSHEAKEDEAYVTFLTGNQVRAPL